MAFPPRIIETERLLLRVPTAADADTIHDCYVADPIACKYLQIPVDQTRESTLTFTNDAIATWEEDAPGLHVWVVLRRTDETVIGTLGARTSPHMLDIGYSFGRQFWNMGLCTEAVRALIATAFQNPHVYRVQAVADADNHASTRVMQKAGMVHEGTLQRYSVHPHMGEAPRDCEMYAIVRV